MTDLITNSSTTIYTYSENSEGALKDMINEIFSVLRVGKRCEDVFTLSVTLDGIEYYGYYFENNDKPDEFADLEDSKLDEAIEAVVKKVVNGEIQKPQWMKDAEEHEDGEGYRPGTTLNIVPKLPEYEKLSKLITNFLYSTSQESSYG
jgi:hypothetical protein